MWFSGGKRLLYLSVVMVLLVMWVCCHSCQVGAIRVFPTNAVTKVKFSPGNVGNKSKEDLLHKYFSGRAFGTQKGFDESKRKVPSCPDPLHN